MKRSLVSALALGLVGLLNPGLARADDKTIVIGEQCDRTGRMRLLRPAARDRSKLDAMIREIAIERGS